MLQAARVHHPRGVYDQSTLALSVGVPVALCGLQDVPDRTLCDELSAGQPGADCAGACGTYSDGGTTFGDSPYGGLDFGGGGGDSSGGGSSCGGGSSSCGGGGGCGGGG